MALWLVRAGRSGEYLQHFLDTNRIYVTEAGDEVMVYMFRRRK